MSITYKINDRVVTKEELDAWHAERVAMFGEDFFDMSKWGGRAPSIRTNDTFMRGKKNNSEHALDLTEDTLAEYQRIAARNGVSTSGKHYYGSLARTPGDPRAWCGSLDEVIASAKRQKIRIEVNGRVYDYRDKYREVKNDEKYAVAEDIVQRDTQRHMDEEYGKDAIKLTAKQRREIKNRVRESIQPEGM